MAFFDYICSDAPDCPTLCEDHWVSLGDAARIRNKEDVLLCPSCGEPMEEIFQPAAIAFKGPGWHDQDRDILDTKLRRRNARIDKMSPQEQEAIKWKMKKAGKSIKTPSGK